MKEHIKENNKDFLFVVAGEEGTGKSALSLMMAKHLDPNFDVEKQVAFSSQEFRRKASQLEPFKPIIFDEAIEGLYSRNAVTKENKKTIQFLRKCREMNLIIFLNLPQLSELDKPIRKHRAKSVIRCVKQGWAWVYGTTKTKRIQKRKYGKLKYPKYPTYKIGWRDPENAIPETWKKYQKQKMKDIQDLKDQEEPNTSDKWMSVGKFAESVGVTNKTVRNWCNEGEIDFKRLPNEDRRIPKSQVDVVLND
ncbi:MAG: excisionase family DNA binding protein [Candidatus Nanohaloarchaea archaeon]|jgi:excisionase family DNA binding protein